MKELEDYLGPLMGYNDNGVYVFIKKRDRKDIWIYEYYQIIKGWYYTRLRRKKR